MLALGRSLPQKFRPFVKFVMAKKQKVDPNAEALELLKDILPKTVPDQKLVDKILSACEKQISTRVKVEAFQKFCTRAELPSLESETVSELQQRFEETFGKGTVSIIPHPKKQAASVEVVMDGEVLEGVLKVGAARNGEADEEEPEFKPKFIPFPVSLESDPELVWVLGRGENLTPEEGGMALTKLQDDFWASKQGQKLLKDRVERSFPEFISRVPSKLLREIGVKRHYKEPEPVKQLRRAPAR